jgi:hypothetical protein
LNKIYLENEAVLLTPNNRFKSKPLGIVIEDSVNNLAFPIPIPIIDNNKVNLPLIYSQYLSIYKIDNITSSILPWHYVIEFFNNNYIIYNTRPIDLTYIYTTNDIKKLAKPILNNNTKEILDSSIELKNMLHILIVGDSTQDVYTRQLYNKIFDFIIGPISRLYKFTPTLNTTIFLLNLGPRFLNNVLYSTFKS